MSGRASDVVDRRRSKSWRSRGAPKAPGMHACRFGCRDGEKSPSWFRPGRIFFPVHGRLSAEEIGAANRRAARAPARLSEVVAACTCPLRIDRMIRPNQHHVGSELLTNRQARDRLLRCARPHLPIPMCRSAFFSVRWSRALRTYAIVGRTDPHAS
jgi:hypothetical protein